MAAANKKQKPSFNGLVRITSLGCAKNFVDTEVASASFLCNGFGLTDLDEEADIQFINTCAFLKAAREEASGVIRDLKVWKESRAGRLIIVAGCFVEWAKTKDLAAFSFVDAWMRIDLIADAGKIALGLLNGKQFSCKLPKAPQYIYDENTPRVQLTPPHYAYIKMSDGCDNCCAYCLIPSIRGSLRSRTEESVLKESKALIASGVKELILIAQDSGGFGRDLDGKPHLASLLKKLDKLRGNFYIRLMYIHPASVNDELLAALQKSKHLIRCIEMPIQHIADNVLKKMGRKIYGKQTREVVKSIMELGYAVRTTLMTGFPGETEDDFQELLQFVKETEFERLGVFAYSKEPGTRAAKMANPVPGEVGEERRAELLKAQKKISLKHNKKLKDSIIEVIVDEITGKGIARGRTLFDAPDIDNIVNLKYKGKMNPGDVVHAKVEQVRDYELDAVYVKEKAK